MLRSRTHLPGFERTPLQWHRMRNQTLNTPNFGPLGTVALLRVSSLPDPSIHLGLLVFTILTAAIGLYLIYTMLRPGAF